TRFGAAVATDIERDQIILGAPGNAPVPGAVYLISGKTGDRVPLKQSTGPVPGKRFGASIAARDSAVVIGAPGNQDSPGAAFAEDGAGAVYLFEGESGRLLREFQNPGDRGDLFGSSVTAVGSDVLIGAPLADVASVLDAGRAYLFNAGTADPPRVFTKPGAAA